MGEARERGFLPEPAGAGAVPAQRFPCSGVQGPQGKLLNPMNQLSPDGKNLISPCHTE